MTRKLAFKLPGDKSLSHRALILAALSSQRIKIHNLLEADDIQATCRCLQSLGVGITVRNDVTVVQGRGRTLQPPTQPLDCGNSGTTMRLLAGVLAAQPFVSVLTGDSSLCSRPMERLKIPLEKMGAKIELTPQGTAPMTIHGTKLKPLDYELPIASAQLKSALLLAGYCAQTSVKLAGKIQSRDHTERLLQHWQSHVMSSKKSLRFDGTQLLKPQELSIPGDFSSAAFLLAATAILPGSALQLTNIGLNPTRTAFLQVLERMGIQIKTTLTDSHPEPVGTLEIQAPQCLQATQVKAPEAPFLIDEIPLVAVLGLFAQGETSVQGAGELRHKESNRLEVLQEIIQRCGGKLTLTNDGFKVLGSQTLKGTDEPFTLHDHRMAMLLRVLNLRASKQLQLTNPDVVNVSYPHFFEHLHSLTNS